MSLARPFLIVSLLLLPGLSHAQARPDTARTRRESKSAEARPYPSEFMEQQMDMMGQMMTNMMTSMFDALGRAENVERMATFTKNYFDALMAKGFTRDEALRIVIGQGIPMPSGR